MCWLAMLGPGIDATNSLTAFEFRLLSEYEQMFEKLPEMLINLDHLRHGFQHKKPLDAFLGSQDEGLLKCIGILGCYVDFQRLERESQLYRMHSF